MKFFHVLSVLSAFLLALSLAHAQCIQINTAKSSYLSGETFQAEITGNLIKPLEYDDISFSYAGKEYFPVATLQQISSNKWIIFSDVSEKYGINEFSVNSIICRENETLKEQTAKAQFAVRKSLQSHLSSLIDRVDGRWASISTDEISRAVIALSEFPVSSDGKKELVKRGAECWPSQNCSVKSTVLAMLASNNSDAREWLNDAQNSISTGLWNLITESDAAKECVIKVNNNSFNISVPSGTTEFPLSLPDEALINISLNCPVTAKISHTYMGSVHEFPLGVISNEKCWGKYYRTSCDALSTAYALQIISDTKARTWLQANAKSTEEIAYAYYYTKSPELSQFLTNNQNIQGYWTNSSLALSNKSDVFSTIAAINALNGNAKAETWLRDNLDLFSLEEKSAALKALRNKTEPLLSIQNGYIKANSFQNVSFKISNKGIFDTQISAAIMNSAQNIIIPAKSTVSVIVQMPDVSSLTVSSLDITSTLGTEQRGYSIPAIIIPYGKTEQEINLAEQNITQETLKPASFNFLQPILNETVNIGEPKAFNLSIKNSGSEKITLDVTIWGLSDIIESGSIPVTIDVAPNSVAVLPVTFKAPSAGQYSGQINVESKGSSSQVQIYLNTAAATVSAKSCSELGGKICLTTCIGNHTSAKDGDCCFGNCSQAQGTGGISTKTIGIAMVVLAVLVAAAFIFFKLRKPKKKSLEKVLEKIREESKSTPFEEKMKENEKI